MPTPMYIGIPLSRAIAMPTNANSTHISIFFKYNACMICSMKATNANTHDNVIEPASFVASTLPETTSSASLPSIKYNINGCLFS